MTDTSISISEDTWPLTPDQERKIILSRFCDRTQLETVGEYNDLNWFNNNSVSYGNEDDAIDRLADELTSPDELEDTLNRVDPDPYRFDWFYGWHYIVEGTDTPTVTRGPAKEHWCEVIEETQQQTAGREKLAAFLRGIIDDDSSTDVVRVDFSTAEARGNKYLDDSQLSASHIATEPGLITGITTRKGSRSGRSYKVAPELIPVIETAIDQQRTDDSGPVSTPSQEVPNELDRRVPKFTEILDEIDLTADDRRRFESLMAEHDALEYWKDAVAPTIKFRPRAKKVILCMLASPDDEAGTKGRTNAIIYGPPGTGKSAFKDFLVEEFESFSIDGARVSKVDLTYNKNTEEDGLLVRAHKGLAVIEEADEMDEDALGAALTALGESGQIEIRDMRLPAEVRGIMLGNYRSQDEIIAKHSEALFNRFEFVLEFDRLDSSERDAAIDLQYDHFRQPTEPAKIEELQKYIKWVREFDPALPDTELEQIKQFKHNNIETFENVREGISVLNVAYTIARLNHRDITLQDYKQAFKLTDMGKL